MPAGPQCAATYDDQSFAYDSHTAVSPRDLAELTGDESAASILQSVKEQVMSLVEYLLFRLSAFYSSQAGVYVC